MLKTESGPQILSANLLKTIQSIREIVGNHSDSEIYNALKESNMDPNETAQKLLNQDTFHEVRRRRDKKKENAVHNGYTEPRKHSEYVPQGAKVFNSDRNAHRGGYTRSAVYDAGICREFRVVRDNRVNQNSDREARASAQVSSSVTAQHTNVSEKSVSVSSNHQKHLGGRYIQNRVTDFRSKLARDFNSNTRKEHLDRRRSQVSMMKSTDSQNPISSNTVGVYASTSDPVHVPSPDSRSSSAIGAIRCEVGIVGSPRQSSESTSKLSFQQRTSNLHSAVGSLSGKESSWSMDTVSQIDQVHIAVAESAVMSSTGGRVGNHFSSRLHQQTAGHQKGFLPSKEWKPKTSQKPVPSPGVIGSPVKSASKSADDSKNSDRELDVLENKLSQVNIHEGQNVIIAQHIRIPENDCCRLTFGSFGLESDGIENSASASQATERAEEAASDPSSSNKQINSVDDQVPRSDSSSPPPSEAAEDWLPEKRDSSGVPNAEDCTDMTLAHKSPSFTASESQQNLHHTDLPSFSPYDPQAVYDMPYFRRSADGSVGGLELPPPQEALSSHSANSVPASSVAMMQQQAHMGQMYPQLHVSHFTNVMPYRQFLSPLYVPPVVPGYSGNPGYPHLPNGSNYVLMPGSSSHLAASNLKYGVQQFKPLPVGSPAGFCNFANPPAYAINAPGVVGGPVGLDDSSRLKYKDINLYAPNPPAETSEVWIQNQREIAGIQSTPYFNIQGQTAAHPAYLQSHPGHASFNAAGLVQQSSHMQFPGIYPQQPNVMPNAHHNMGIGVGPAAPGPQVGGAFQQPQLSHLNWTANY